jgi:hypothetical protein
MAEEETRVRDNFDTVAKLLTGAVAIVITATGTIGAASGGFAFLLRNAQLLVIVSLTLAAIAALVAGIGTVWPQNRSRMNLAWQAQTFSFLLSSLLLFTSLGVLLYAQVGLQGVSSRPVVTAEWTTVGMSVGLKVSAEANDVLKDQVLTFNVVGRNANGNRLPFYRSSSGPDDDGKAKTQATVVINPPAQFHLNTVFVVAAVLDIDLGIIAPLSQVDCSGEVLEIAPNGYLTPTRQQRFIGATACLIFSSVPTLQPSATPK